MSNVEKVTHHINSRVLRLKRDLGGQTLNLFPARAGEYWIEDDPGAWWRCYHHIEGGVYFKTHRPGHNLDRCRTLLRLVR
jgi:hypothetical protein